MNKQPDCLECEKLAKVADESNKIGDFLSWLGDNGYFLQKWESESDFIHLGDSAISTLLAKYYKIDLDKVEQERSALLDWLRKQQYENKT